MDAILDFDVIGEDYDVLPAGTRVLASPFADNLIARGLAHAVPPVVED